MYLFSKLLFCKDACNLVSISEFYKTHPKLRGRSKANLVLVCTKATDNRHGGEASTLAKSLKAFGGIGFVDKVSSFLLYQGCQISLVN